jgi:sulfur relay (sulfurtransferase) complex TusBCD TusD component (DsrE family)
MNSLTPEKRGVDLNTNGPCEDCRGNTTETRATRVGKSIATVFLCARCDDNRGLTAKANLLRMERPSLSPEDIVAHLAVETKRFVSFSPGRRFPFRFEVPIIHET